ncbi:MAG: TonB-dependent receptor family protein [Archangium sp.]
MTVVVSMSAGQVDGGADGFPDAGVETKRRETTVTSARMVDVRRVAGSAQVIGREELERQESNDMNRVLQGVPGVYVREEDGFGLRPNIGIRGGSADRSAKVTLMEDGVLYGPAPYSAPAAYFTPLMTRMVGVEIYKGPAAIRFGPQTIGGALNLRTREVSRQLEVDADASLGNYGTAKLHGVVGYGNERMGLLLEGVHLQSEGFKELSNRSSTGFDKNEFMLKGRFAFEESGEIRNELQVKLGFSNERSNETYLGLSNDDFAVNPLSRYPTSELDQMNWWRTQGVLTHTLKIGQAFELRTDVYRHDYERAWYRFDHFRVGPSVYQVLAYPQTGARAVYGAILAGREDSAGRDQQLMILNNERRFISEGIQSTGVFKFMSGPIAQELELGLRFHHDSIVRLHTQDGYDMRAGHLVSNGEASEVVNDNTGLTRSFSAHVSDTMTWGNFLLAPGARIEVFDATLNDRLADTSGQQLNVVPLLGIGAVYAFDFGLSVVGGVHQGFSPPAAGQVGALAERAINTEFGARFARRGVRLEAIGFWSEYQNITGACTGSSGCLNDRINEQFNGGAARILGLEALGGVKGELFWGLRGAADVSYTLTDARFLSDFQSANVTWGSVRTGYQLPYIPVHQGQLRVRLAKGPVELGFGAMYYGALRELAGEGEIPDPVRILARVLLDATASVELGPARVYFTATNLTNQTQVVSRLPFGARPQAPFTFQAGLKYSFR